MDLEWLKHVQAWCDEGGLDSAPVIERIRESDWYKLAYAQWKTGATDRVVNALLQKAYSMEINTWRRT